MLSMFLKTRAAQGKPSKLQSVKMKKPRPGSGVKADAAISDADCIANRRITIRGPSRRGQEAPDSRLFDGDLLFLFLCLRRLR
jgi:hypothetical protein